MDDTARQGFSRPLGRGDATTPPATRAAGRATSGTGPERSLASAPRVRIRRCPVDACEVCGRLLLTGEGTRQIISGEHVLEACSLCVISAAAHDASRRVA
jgi:hypothetical protein